MSQAAPGYVLRCQTPPTRSSFSKTMTSSYPSRRSIAAAPPPPKPPPTTAIERRRSDTEALHAEVAEWLVPLANGPLEPPLGRTAHEAMALLGVAGDAVEEGAEQLRLVQPLREEALV